ncbi:MAG: mucoidy inhibitor MuiA family protein [Planctomycetota bacterium]|jgi:uncharacterized protein (TIGR02231 family)|nr:mucoidy inhibitor MuiA family protein [Planctomycetota bacterium]
MKLNPIITFVICGLCCNYSLSAQENVVHVESSIERVTVYPGFAMVERIIEVPAQSQLGGFELLVGPIPMSAKPSSIRTQVIGDAVAVQGVDLRTRMSTVANLAKASELEKALAEWDNKLIDASAIQRGIAMQIKALNSLASALEKKSIGSAKTEDLGAQLEFLGREMTLAEKDSRHNELLIKEIKQNIYDIELQINGAKNDRGERIREAKISCFAQSPEASQIKVIYLVSGANWQPAYDVRISPDLSDVNINLMGQVSQSSGESWEQVQLVLSTSMPQLGLDPPEIPRLIVESGEIVVPESLGYASGGLAAVEEERSIDFYAESALVEELESEVFDAAPRVEVSDFGITTQFTMPGRVDVAKNGEDNRFSIRTIPLEVSPERYVVPSQSNSAFLRAEVKHNGDAVLLAGRAKIFLGPDYLGESSFPLLRQNDTTMLNLGIDPNLEIKYETIEDFRDDPGSFSLSSTSTLTRRYRANLRLAPAARSKIKVVLEEALPKSNSDAVEVEILELTPAALASDSDLEKSASSGLYRWEFTLHPGESRVVKWGYELSFDEDITPMVREL